MYRTLFQSPNAISIENDNKIYTTSTIRSTTIFDSREEFEDFVVLPGPEDILIVNKTNGIYKQSVTLTARMYPIEANVDSSIWGLPALIWGLLLGTIVILILILATLFFCCWLQPKTRKLLNSSYYTANSVPHRSVVPKSYTADSNQLVMPLQSIGICPPQYTAPPPPIQASSTTLNSMPTQYLIYQKQYHDSHRQQQQQQQMHYHNQSNNTDQQQQHHKSMWAINPLYASSGVLSDTSNDTNSSYRTRSLPAWGKNKQRPVSNADDLEELYAKVNFSKKRRNRMRNNEAAIIALSRSRSQNLSSLVDQDAVIVYDERTAL